MYRVTKKRAALLARMRAAKESKRLAGPAPEYPHDLPDLRRRIVIEDFDFGHQVHVMEMYKTSRVDCYRVVVAKVDALFRKARDRCGIVDLHFHDSRANAITMLARHLDILAYGLALFAVVIAGGLWLIAQSGAGLFWIGLAGLAIGWAYSAPPLKLNSRGLGEVCVATGFLFIVAGSDFVQQGRFDALPWVAGLPYALLVTNVLYINQFPDREADRLAGKWHWVARLEPRVAARGYWLILVLAVVSLAGAVLEEVLPAQALASLLGFLPALKAGRLLSENAAQPSQLVPPIRLTILAAHLQPIILAAVLFWSAA